ncbi:hypothetical protein MMC21_006962 [Puttea exsequens]|nr:hypothetical protein [Puttea exsequens]
MKEKHPELFLPETNIDRRQCKRVVPMEVMNLGFPRTGTMSMQAALNILGYTCYHSSIFFTNPQDCNLWNAALDAKYLHRGPPFTLRDWDQLLGRYSAVSADPPAVAFAEDLIAAYPSAKVILVERELESWFTSFDCNIISAQWSPFISFVSALDPWMLGPVRACHRRWATGWMEARGRGEMREKARGKYREHYALVRRVVPEGMLLEYKLGEGWGPLCEFLAKPVPEVPFPRVNDSEALQELLAVVIRRGLWNSLRRVSQRFKDRLARDQRQAFLVSLRTSEHGFAWIDLAEINSIPPRKLGINWHPFIKATHWINQEFRHFMLRTYGVGDSHNFWPGYGKSEAYETSQGPAPFRTLFAKIAARQVFDSAALIMKTLGLKTLSVDVFLEPPKVRRWRSQQSASSLPRDQLVPHSPA